MKILVVDSDLAIQDYYRSLLESEFRNVEVRFLTSLNAALELLTVDPYDLVLSECDESEINFFDFLETVVKKAIPIVIVTSRQSERFIVECMRAGALDYISKPNIKLGHLPAVITRTLLEADRWSDMQQHASTLPYRPEFVKMNQRLRSFLKDEQIQQKRSLISRGLRAEKELVLKEGEAYYITFLYLSLYIPATVARTLDADRLGEMRGLIMKKITEIPDKYGGKLWTLKEDGCFFAFVGDAHVSALLSAIEMHSVMNVFNVTFENLVEPLCVNIGLASGRTVYRENKGDIYSEALNLSAHMAYHKPEENNIMVTAEVYENLWPRAKKYFFRTEPFEGQNVYRFESIA